MIQGIDDLSGKNDQVYVLAVNSPQKAGGSSEQQFDRTDTAGGICGSHADSQKSAVE